MIDKRERLFYLCIFVFFLGALLYTGAFPLKSARYPRLICSLGVFVTAFLLVMSTLRDRKIRSDSARLKARLEEMARRSLTLAELKGIGVFLGFLVGYVMVISVLGFYTSTAVFLVTLMSVLQKKFSIWYAVVSVLFTLMIYLVFAQFLHLATPQGVLF